VADNTMQFELSADIKNFTAAMQSATSQLAKIADQSKKTQSSLGNMEKSFAAVGNAAKAFIGLKLAEYTSQFAAGFVKMVEGPKQFEATIKALTGSAEQAKTSLADVYAISMRTGVGFSDVTDAMSRLTIAFKPLGANQQTISAMTQSIIDMGRLSGTSMADITGAMLQFSQAMGSGKLQGDELRSIMERMPVLGQKIAEGLGVSTAALKEMGARGELTAPKIYEALRKVFEKINADANALPLQMAGAFNKIQTALTKAFDTEFFKNAVGGLANIIEGFANQIIRVSNNIKLFINDLNSSPAALGAFQAAVLLGAGAITSYMVPALIAMARAAQTAMASMLAFARANPLVAFATAAAAGAALVISNWTEVKAFFTQGLPAAFQTAKGHVQTFIGGVQDLFNGLANKVKAVFEDMINGIIGSFNRFIESFNNSGLAQKIGVQFQPLAEVKLIANEAGEAINKFIVEGNANIEAGKKAWAEYRTEMQKTSEVAKNAGVNVSAAQNTVNNVGGAGGKGGADSLKTWAENLLRGADAARAYKEDMEKLAQALKKGYINQAEFDQGAKKLKDTLDKAGKSSESMQQQMATFASNALNGFFDAIASGKSFGEVLKNLALDMAKLLAQTLIIKPLLNSLFGGGGALGSIFGGGKSFGSDRLSLNLPGGTDGDYSGFRAAPIPSLRLPSIGSGTSSGSGETTVTLNFNENSVAVTSSDNAKEMGDRIKQAVLMTIAQEKRPGGLLR